MFGEFWQPQFEEVAEDGHVHGEAAQVVGEVALGQDALDHEDHHLVVKKIRKKKQIKCFNCANFFLHFFTI